MLVTLTSPIKCAVIGPDLSGTERLAKMGRVTAVRVDGGRLLVVITGPDRLTTGYPSSSVRIDQSNAGLILKASAKVLKASSSTMKLYKEHVSRWLRDAGFSCPKTTKTKRKPKKKRLATMTVSELSTRASTLRTKLKEVAKKEKRLLALQRKIIAEVSKCFDLIMSKRSEKEPAKS